MTYYIQRHRRGWIRLRGADTQSRFDLLDGRRTAAAENAPINARKMKGTIKILVDKVKDELQKVIDLLEKGETDIEAVARECIAASVAYILEWFDFPIDTEEAIRERDW